MKIDIKKIFGGLLVAALIAALIAIPVAAADGNGIPQRHKGLFADTVLLDGKIITVDSADSIAEAVAIKDGKIVAVGSDKEIKEFIGKSTQVIDLNGLTATPGLIDAHVHFEGTSMLYVLDLSCLEVSSIADVVDKVEAQVEILEPGEWVQGRGWAEGHLAEQRYIYASDIDPVSPNNPAWLLETSYHMGTANSYALDLAGITKDTPDPPGGTIDRYPDGTPTGVLKEAAMGLVRALVPPFTPEQQVEGLIKICEEANKEGMTAILYPGIGLSTWEVYQDVLAQDKLSVRAMVLWRTGETIEDAQDLIDRVAPFTKPYLTTGDDRLISGGIKMLLDGCQDAGTHWSWQEHTINYDEGVNEGWYGYPRYDPDIYREQVIMFHNAGLHIETHAIGDRTIDWVLGSYELALEEKPTEGLRHGVIHCDIPTDWAIETMAEMQEEFDAGYPYANSVFMWWTEIIASTMGPELSLREMPFKTWLEEGILFGQGSDYSVDPLGAKYGIWASITRETLMELYGPTPFGLDESIDVNEALRSYTASNAYLLFMEDKIGSIEVGKYADIAIWDKDMYTIPTDEIKDLNCLMTLLEGEIVYSAPDSPISVTNP